MTTFLPGNTVKCMPRPKNPRTIGEWIAASKGQWTQERLAAELGVAQPLVWRWVHGKTSPAQKHWPKLARLTGLPVTAFMRKQYAAAMPTGVRA